MYMCTSAADAEVVPHTEQIVIAAAIACLTRMALSLLCIEQLRLADQSGTQRGAVDRRATVPFGARAALIVEQHRFGFVDFGCEVV